jgi:DNA methyltransferase 1-associated protein 1
MWPAPLTTDNWWSYNETKYLFDLCRDYDLRWLIIHDRYTYIPKEGEYDGWATAKDNDVKEEDEDRESKEEGRLRGLEDLKSRYYDVCRSLLMLRQKHGDTLSPVEEDLMKQMKFSKENELKRKAHLEKLLARNPGEVAEEEALVIESRKLEAAAERMLQERQELLRLLDSPQSTASVSQYQTSQGLAQLTQQLLTTDKTRKQQRKDNSGSSTPSASGSSVPVSSAVVTAKKQDVKKNNVGVVAQVIQKKLSAKEEAAFGISYHDRLTPGVYIRSTRIASLKSSLQQKAQGIMQELGLPSRPVMPTAKVCAKFDSLQHSIGVLLEAKRQEDKLETELRILRSQKGQST